MAAAIIIAIAIMLLASESLSRFVNAHISVKLLALSFLILVGMALIADGIGFHIPRGYLYFAIAFSAFVEFPEPAGGETATEEGVAPGAGGALMRRSRFRTGSQLNTQPSRLAWKECAESERTANPVQTTAISGVKGVLLERC